MVISALGVSYSYLLLLLGNLGDLSRRSVSALRAGGARGRRLDDPVMSTTVIPADFKLPIGIGALGLALSGSGNLGGGFVLTALGLGLAFQATRVSIEFDDNVSRRHMLKKASTNNGCTLGTTQK